ncbi:MAG: hypothetical protein H0W43_05895 [Chthoniobacterales bacterium]|nr:hypothetical protein [Chthoniobacterales bacterium]
MQRSLYLLAGALVCLFLISTSGAEAAEDSDGVRQFTEADLPSLEKDPAGPSEIDEVAGRHGFRYARDTRRAARGDFKALKKFFQIAYDADGAAAESIQGVPTVVYHLLGDEKFAGFLALQPIAYRMMVRNLILSTRDPVGAQEFQRDFPLSAPLLFSREMVAWPSPNGLYAIRKVFSHETELAGSKVTRAELIEQKTGRVLCDLTADDIGTGAEREGEVLWSPDSKRVACLSIDLPDQPGNLFSTPRPPVQRKQTTVYQLAGDSFSRVELSLGDAPGQENDPALKRASVGHIYTEPVKWQKPNILVLQRHEYYAVIQPITSGNQTFDSIGQLGRLYQITATIGPDGKGTAVWKLRPD